MKSDKAVTSTTSNSVRINARVSPTVRPGSLTSRAGRGVPKTSIEIVSEAVSRAANFAVIEAVTGRVTDVGTSPEEHMNGNSNVQWSKVGIGITALISTHKPLIVPQERVLVQSPHLIVLKVWRLVLHKAVECLISKSACLINKRYNSKHCSTSSLAHVSLSIIIITHPCS